MPRIHQLPPGVIAKIAAGEVIERPASVVKELLENAVDAGAHRIDIDLEAGGTELIRIVDDGCGIVPEDLPLAFAAHATSKLRNADDLFRIDTMGFRGEALSSIAGIAKVTLQSRPHDRESGAELRIDDGELSPVRPWNGAPGTRLEVRHLFYNVPVRKKFLKTHATELGHVTETVTRLALANPRLHLVLKHNGKLVYEVPASAGLLDRIGLFFGKEIREAMLEVDSGPGDRRVRGYIADPKVDRGNAKLQYLFVNGRWFRDRSLAHAMQDSYRGLLMTGRYCIGFLFLTLPPDQVDVNVHPTKAEVRFQENSTIYSLVRAAVKSRLLRENLIPHLTPPLGEEPSAPPSGPADWFHAPPQTMQERLPFPVPEAAHAPERGASAPRVEELDEEPVPVPIPAMPPEAPQHASHPQHGGLTPPAQSVESPPPGTAIQLHDSYLVIETRDGMLVIDQHALHERILFEQLQRRVRDGQLEVQRLLIPEPIELPAEQAALVLEAADQLQTLGLEVSDFGGNTVLLSSYPTLLKRKAPHEIFQAVLDELLSKERPPSKEALLHLLMATMACKAAVKAGDPLTKEEIAYLLHLRAMAEDSHHCPHGRPTSLLFSRTELDKQFKRT
ncbi:MAG: DNA mismatch repair endonuclease MutL [Gemmataceae bacterium]